MTLKNHDARPNRGGHHSASAGRTAPINLQTTTELRAASRLSQPPLLRHSAVIGIASKRHHQVLLPRTAKVVSEVTAAQEWPLDVEKAARLAEAQQQALFLFSAIISTTGHATVQTRG